MPATYSALLPPLPDPLCRLLGPLKSSLYSIPTSRRTAAPVASVTILLRLRLRRGLIPGFLGSGGRSKGWRLLSGSRCSSLVAVGFGRTNGGSIFRLISWRVLPLVSCLFLRWFFFAEKIREKESSKKKTVVCTVYSIIYWNWFVFFKNCEA